VTEPRSPVRGLDVVGKRLGLLVPVMVVAMSVVVVLGSDVLHLVDAAALGAALDGAGTRHLEAGCVSKNAANGERIPREHGSRP